MADGLSITPVEPLVGAPITVVLEMGKVSPSPRFAMVRKMDLDRKNVFQVELKAQGEDKSVAQFAIYEAGLYQVETGSIKVPLTVIQAQTVPFFVEIGFLGGMVCLILGGLVIWNKQRKGRA